jgi:hypothetical protein
LSAYYTATQVDTKIPLFGRLEQTSNNSANPDPRIKVLDIPNYQDSYGYLVQFSFDCVGGETVKLSDDGADLDTMTIETGNRYVYTVYTGGTIKVDVYDATTGLPYPNAGRFFIANRGGVADTPYRLYIIPLENGGDTTIQLNYGFFMAFTGPRILI